MGPDPNSKWIITGMVLFQILSLFIVKEFSNLWLFLAAYVVGGTINHSLMLGMALLLNFIAYHSVNRWKFYAKGF